MICNASQLYSKKGELNESGRKKGKRLRLITVRTAPGDRTMGLINAGGTVIACALGRSGISAQKREGDGATPLASMAVLSGYLRGDREKRKSGGIALRITRADDGWCDAPNDANYNRPVRLPSPASTEAMRRDDRLYDICLVLDWNIRSRRRNRGSAIFFHLARPDFSPTEGCIAIQPAAMRRLLPLLRRGTVIRVLR